MYMNYYTINKYNLAINIQNSYTSLQAQSMMFINNSANRQKPNNRSFFPALSNRRSSARSYSISHNLNISKVCVSKETQPKQYKQLTFYVGRGNNEGVVRDVMSKRENWVQSDDSTSAFLNMKWQPDQKGIRYNRLVESGQYRGVVNHFQFHEQLSNKQYLFRNLQKYCSKTDTDLGKIVPPTYILNCRDQCSMQILKQFTDLYQKYFPQQLKKRCPNAQKEFIQHRKKLRSYFFNSNLKKAVQKNPPMPSVFVNEEEGDYLWIVKPTFLNRGRGIQVFSKLSELTKFVSQNVEGYIEKKMGENVAKNKIFVDYIKKNTQQVRLSTQRQQMEQQQQNRQYQQQQKYWRQRRQYDQFQPTFDGNQYIRVIPGGPALIKTDCFLIQKYLQKPLLVLNRKFDIRMWVLVSQSLKVFVFPEGYLRLSSRQYTCNESNNAFVHLTNNSVQKFSNQYGKVADGNQLSFKELKNIMEEKQLDFQESKKKMYEHIQVSMNATIKKLNENNRKFVFEIFGYDFMIDETGHPWLIEVNTNPCLEESSKLLTKLIPRMLDDAFKLTIDYLFYGSFSSGNYPVEGYGKENMWVNLKLDEK